MFNEPRLFSIVPSSTTVTSSAATRSPIRPENSIGLVIERKREPHHKDGLMWFSDEANALLYEEYFHLTNIEKDFFTC